MQNIFDVFIIVGIAFCIATMMFRDSSETPHLNISEREKDAIYIGIAFLDAFLRCFQGLIVFGLFGLETHLVIDPLVHWVETLKDLYDDSPKTDTDPRLYHWTIKFASKLFPCSCARAR